MQKLILTNFQSPGDLVMLTAAVRDLHSCYPGRFLTDVRSSCPAIWQHNPHLTALKETDPSVRVLPCHYPLIHACNNRPVHFLEGFVSFLNEELHLQIRLSRMSGDLHLSSSEKRTAPIPRRITGVRAPYWVVVAGGKFDFTIKWWHFRRWQAVVDHFRDRLLFVQAGEKGHYHPPLKGALDLRGKTTLREFIQLVYHADGILCPVTLAMHLAPALPPKPGGPDPRPCVVVAGGREPPTWEAYPTHQFLHTIGVLPCCAHGGCWRSRTVPLEDGDPKDQPENLCVAVVEGLPACMRLITPQDVIGRIETYLAGNSQSVLDQRQNTRLQPRLRPASNLPTLTELRQKARRTETLRSSTTQRSSMKSPRH